MYRTIRHTLIVTALLILGGLETSFAQCDDGDRCNGEEIDHPILGCLPSPDPLVCDDHNVCTIDTCDPSDGCVFTETIVCDDSTACTVDTCNPSAGCVFTPLPPCTDGNACTTESCDPVTGGCVTTHTITCDDGDESTTDTCDPATGDCVFTPCNDNNVCNGVETYDETLGCISGPALVCNDDGNICNGPETCDETLGCVSGPALVCNDGDICTIDTCDPSTGCEFTPVFCGGNNTPEGSDVSVTVGTTEVTFNNVSVAGNTTVTAINPDDAGTVPGGFVIFEDLAWDVSTSATVEAPIIVCFHVDGVTDPDVFALLRVLHNEGGVLVDRTILPPDSPAPDFDSGTLCAGVDSLSPFVVAMLQYDFVGFAAPVDNLPTVNIAKAGSAVPVKFSLGGDQGLNIFSPGYPTSGPIACSATDVIDPIEQTVTAGSSSLSYDAPADQYVYVWKTSKSWAGTCRQLVIKLNDGSYHRANFKFAK